MELDYEHDLEIDSGRLDREFEKQPRLVYEYGSSLAREREKLNLCEEDVKVVRSDLFNEYKEDNPKGTDKAAEAYYRTHPKHQKAKKAMIAQQRVVDRLEIAVRAIVQKKDCLSEVLRMQMSELYAAPKLTQGMHKSLEDSSEQRTRNKMRARRRA